MNVVERILDDLRKEGKITPSQWDLWFRELRYEGIEGNRLFIRVPNELTLEWFLNEHKDWYDEILDRIRLILPDIVAINLVLRGRKAMAKQSTRPVRPPDHELTQWQQALEAVSVQLGLDSGELFSSRRFKPITTIRKAMMYVLRRDYGLSSSRTARILNRHHSTVIVNLRSAREDSAMVAEVRRLLSFNHFSTSISPLTLENRSIEISKP